MKPEIIKADTAGMIVSWDNGNDVYYIGSSCPPIGNGICYKDRQAFEDQQGICYIPEHGFFDQWGLDNVVSNEMLNWMSKHHISGYVSDGAGGYTYNDLRERVEEWVGDQLDGMCSEYIRDLFVDYITERLFESLDWQCPDTLLNEWDVMEQYENAPQLSCDDPRLTDKQ